MLPHLCLRSRLANLQKTTMLDYLQGWPIAYFAYSRICKIFTFSNIKPKANQKSLFIKLAGKSNSPASCCTNFCLLNPIVFYRKAISLFRLAYNNNFPVTLFASTYLVDPFFSFQFRTVFVSPYKLHIWFHQFLQILRMATVSVNYSNED